MSPTKGRGMGRAPMSPTKGRGMGRAPMFPIKGRGHGMGSHVPLNGGKRAGDNPGGEHGMSSHVRGGRRVGDRGGRGKNKLLPQPGGTWDELPCPSLRGGMG